MQVQKESRSVTSCTECQRRKQKCSREWPCNHCQARKVPHLCQFGQKRVVALQESPITPSTLGSDPGGLKRTFPELSEDSTPSSETAPDSPEGGLKAWGYMPGHLHYNVGYVGVEGASQNIFTSELGQDPEVTKILHVFPPRSITDAFVNHFLGVVNYRYNSIYAPTFTTQYVQWWSDRSNGKRLSTEFTCLLLRVCAHSGQYLSAALRTMVQYELACNSQVLTDQFAAAADRLSVRVGRLKICLERVQEQFLKGAWLKSESMMVECWHVLGRAIHEAQELGIDKDIGLEGLTEFEKEIRRRVWALLYLWDWQMSAWLGRPHLIDQKDCTFTFPNLRLEVSATEPNLLSPFAHIALQAQLARRINAHKGVAQSFKSLIPDQVIAIEAECERFIEELPPIFRFASPDMSFDRQHPYFVVQRQQLHVVIYMTMFDFLKPYLTQSQTTSKPAHYTLLKRMGIEISLKILRVARRLFDHEFPINAKFHLIVFSLFDTATVLCSAIIHDINNEFPHRESVIHAIESALEMLCQLKFTKIGESSYKFLFRLVETSPVLSRSIINRKRQRINGHGSMAESYGTDSSYPFSLEPPPDVAYPTTEPLPELSANPDLSFGMEQLFGQNSVGENPQPDIGGLEAIWDWETLNIDAFLDQESTYTLDV